jgi:hypothetical protein
MKIVSSPDTVAVPNWLYSYVVSAFSSDYSDSLKFLALQLPPWLSLSHNGVLSGYAPSSRCCAPIAFKVVDGTGRTVVQRFTLYVQPIVVDDFEYTGSPKDHGWSNVNGTGSMAVVYDATRTSNVLSLRSSSSLSYCVVRNQWRRASSFSAIVRSKSDFVLYAQVVDTLGSYYTLSYIPDEGLTTRSGGDIKIHIGSIFRNGEWHSLSRDLESDFADANMQVGLSRINSFIVRGSVDLDDITVGALNESRLTSNQWRQSLAPAVYSLQQNFPNPFNPSTVIDFSLAKPGRVTLKVYNLLGQKIKTFLSEDLQNAGWYHLLWEGTDDSGHRVASGAYVYKIDAEPFDGSPRFTSSRKMLLIK